MRDVATREEEWRSLAIAEIGLATAQAYRGDHRDAIETTTRAVDVARRSNLDHEEARALWIQCWSLVRLGELAPAAALQESVLDICERVGDDALLANALNLAGVIDASTGDFASARGHFEQAAETYTRIGNEPALMPILNNIGVIDESLGRYELAAERYADALTVAERTNNLDAQMVYRSNLGGIEVALGRYDSAERHLDWVIGAEQSGLAVMPETLRFLAEAYSGQGPATPRPLRRPARLSMLRKKPRHRTTSAVQMVGGRRVGDRLDRGIAHCHRLLERSDRLRPGLHVRNGECHVHLCRGMS